VASPHCGLPRSATGTRSVPPDQLNGNFGVTALARPPKGWSSAAVDMVEVERVVVRLGAQESRTDVPPSRCCRNQGRLAGVVQQQMRCASAEEHGNNAGVAVGGGEVQWRRASLAGGDVWATLIRGEKYRCDFGVPAARRDVQGTPAARGFQRGVGTLCDGRNRG